MNVWHPLRDFARFRGRARRKEFWIVLAVILSGTMALGPVGRILGAGDFRLVLLAVWGAMTILPLLSATARRMQDYDLSGWWMVLALVPGIGLLFVLWVALLKGTDGPNRFGPDPRGAAGT